MSIDLQHLRDLADRLADGGPGAVEAELTELAVAAAALGVEPVVIAVLCDQRAADVVRQRAFARVAARLYGSGRVPAAAYESMCADEHDSHYQHDRSTWIASGSR